MNSVGYTNPRRRVAASPRSARATSSTIAQNRGPSSRFGSSAPGWSAAASALSTTASASPVGVSQFSSAITGPSSVRKTSARAMPCHSGCDESHIAFWHGVRQKKSSSSDGSSATSRHSSSYTAATSSAAR
ncbi:hypothetical protein BE20_37760 [Sorangium cellulosum]|nr:hypothetical protein BE20_37760 [Sorangium cellulosum]